MPSSQHPHWFSKHPWKCLHVDPDLRMSPYIHIYLPGNSPELGVPQACQPAPCSFRAQQKLQSYLQLQTSQGSYPGPAGGPGSAAALARAWAPAGAAAPLPGISPDQRPQHAGLLTPPVKIILAAALVLSPGRAAVTEVTHSHGTFSGISLERQLMPEQSRAMMRTRTPAVPHRPGDEAARASIPPGAGDAPDRGAAYVGCRARRDPVLQPGAPH